MTKRLVFLLMMFAAPVTAHDKMSGDLHIIHPSIPQPAAGAKSAAGYVTISNEGDAPEELVGVRTPIAAVTTLHTTAFEDGIAKMLPLIGVLIEPGDVVSLKPGGMHVMFMGLTDVLREGDMIPATLIFRRAGEVEIEFMIDPAGGADHSAMDHSDH